MDNLDGKQAVKALETIQRQAGSLINSILTPEVMDKLTPEQKEQVQQVRKDMNTLGKKGLTTDNDIFKQFN